MRKRARLPDEHKIDVHVAGRLRALRNAAGMSQETVATALGITFQQVQKMEKGVNRIGAGRAALLANLFGVSIDTLFDGVDLRNGRNKEMSQKIGDIDEFMSSRRGATLVAAFGKLGQAQRSAVVELATALAASANIKDA